MFNADQMDHMRGLAEVDPEQLTWCGWFRNERHPHPEYHPHQECPSDLTAADKIAMRCECCRGAPCFVRGVLTHRADCTRDRRREFYSSVDLGGEG